MDARKLICIDVQHAQIATMRLIGFGRRALRIGKNVLTDSVTDKFYTRAYVDAMAYTTELNETDRQEWERHYENDSSSTNSNHTDYPVSQRGSR